MGTFCTFVLVIRKEVNICSVCANAAEERHWKKKKSAQLRAIKMGPR